MFWSAKNSVAIFSCQSLLLGTNVPNDNYHNYPWKLDFSYNANCLQWKVAIVGRDKYLWFAGTYSF